MNSPDGDIIGLNLIKPVKSRVPALLVQRKMNKIDFIGIMSTKIRNKKDKLICLNGQEKRKDKAA